MAPAGHRGVGRRLGQVHVQVGAVLDVQPCNRSTREPSSWTKAVVWFGVDEAMVSVVAAAQKGMSMKGEL
jgi:hypothetical protein